MRHRTSIMGLGFRYVPSWGHRAHGARSSAFFPEDLWECECRDTRWDFIPSWCRGGVEERQRVCRRHFLFSFRREPQRLAVCVRRCRRALAGAPRGA
jgi:hypothetical protein